MALPAIVAAGVAAHALPVIIDAYKKEGVVAALKASPGQVFEGLQEVSAGVVQGVKTAVNSAFVFGCIGSLWKGDGNSWMIWGACPTANCQLTSFGTGGMLSGYFQGAKATCRKLSAMAGQMLGAMATAQAIELAAAYVGG